MGVVSQVMSARYISRRYGETAISRQRAASQSQEREVATPSTTRRYSRARTSSPVRERGYSSQYSTNLHYYRPADNESIHERDLLFSKFTSGTSNLYNAADMTNMKDRFSSMVQDKWNRKQLQDPSVDHDFARKASAWSNYISRGSTSASERLGRKHSEARLEKNNFCLPRIYVYHSAAC